jgi:hypothetical protein
LKSRTLLKESVLIFYSNDIENMSKEPTNAITEGQDEATKGLSFGFSKTFSSKPKFVSKVAEVKEEKDYIVDVKGGKIEGSKIIQVKLDLVIPCSGNKIKFPSLKNNGAKSNEPVNLEVINTEDRAAVEELMKDAKRYEEERERMPGNENDPNFVIPLNLNPDDKESLDADVATRAEASSLDDYESIPVEGFGMGIRNIF